MHTFITPKLLLVNGFHKGKPLNNNDYDSWYEITIVRDDCRKFFIAMYWHRGKQSWMCVVNDPCAGYAYLGSRKMESIEEFNDFLSTNFNISNFILEEVF